MSSFPSWNMRKERIRRVKTGGENKLSVVDLPWFFSLGKAVDQYSM
jgi:hypothetical protein